MSSAAERSGGSGGLHLEVVAGEAAGAIITVEERIVFGRLAEGDASLADDPELSRHHARIMRRADGEYVVEDLASTNGTFVNRERVAAPVVLSPGDLIDLGASRLRVRDVDADATTASDIQRKAIGDAGQLTAIEASAMTVAGVPSPAPAAPESTPAPMPRLELHIVVDVEHGEAEIALGGGEPLRLHLQDGSWRADPD